LIAPAFAAAATLSGAGEALRRAFAAPAPPAMVEVAVTAVAASAAARPMSELACVLFAIWVAGALPLLVALGRPWLQWAAVARRAVPASERWLLHMVRGGAHAGRRTARLAISTEVAEPLVVGWRRPVILLPAGYPAALDAGELRSVLAHELAHVHRGDNMRAALHEIACVLFWFDPLHWLARRELLRLREWACDERVLALGCMAASYVSALAKGCHTAIGSPAVAGMRGLQLRERMDFIMSYQALRRRFVSDRFARWAALAALAALVGAFAVAAPPASFAGGATPDAGYRFEVTVRPGVGGALLVEAEVFTPAGDHVMAAKAGATEGDPVTLSSRDGERSVIVEVTAWSDGSGEATLVVTEGTETVQRTTRAVGPPSGRRPGAEPISLDLKDADLAEVLRTFAQLTGYRIAADPGIEGRVTVTVVDTPWDVALARALAPLGLRPVPIGVHEFRVVRNQGPGGPPLPPGYQRVLAGMKPPEALRRDPPVYPDQARADRIQGVVILQAAIDETGQVQDVTVLKGLPGGLTEAAIEAVRNWEFAPALQEGEPVPVVYNLTINFRLDD
jgi:TonB family protein